MYINILRRLRDAAGRKSPKKGKKQPVSPSRKCSSAPIIFGEGFISKEQCDNTSSSLILSLPGFV